MTENQMLKKKVERPGGKNVQEAMRKLDEKRKEEDMITIYCENDTQGEPTDIRLVRVKNTDYTGIVDQVNDHLPHDLMVLSDSVFFGSSGSVITETHEGKFPTEIYRVRMFQNDPEDLMNILARHGYEIDPPSIPETDNNNFTVVDTQLLVNTDDLDNGLHDTDSELADYKSSSQKSDSNSNKSESDPSSK